MSNDQSMWDLRGWTEVTCEESETAKANSPEVISGVHNFHGGDHRMIDDRKPAVDFTEWGDGDANPTLRDYFDEDGCRHYTKDNTP